MKTLYSRISVFCTYHSVLTVQMKNCDPLVLGPALAILSTPSPVCFKVKFSSGKFLPYMDLPPVPSPRVKSPPCGSRAYFVHLSTNYLYHELWYDAMKFGSLVTVAFLSSA